MAEYHVGCGLMGIYAGTLNKKKTMWVNKSEVTNEAIDSVAQYLLEHQVSANFSYNGNQYKLAVEEMGQAGADKQK